MAKRRKKTMGCEEIVELFEAGMRIAIGGMFFHNRPVAVLRQLIKHGIGDITLYSAPLSSYDVDLLVGAGLVRETYLPHVSFGHLGLAPNYGKAIREKRIVAHPCDQAIVCGGFLASAEGLPFHPVVSLKGTDILNYKNDVSVKKFSSEDGEDFLCVPAISPDIAILYAQEGDEFGNIRHTLAAYADRLIAEASKKVIVSVERLISNDAVRKEPFLTTVPSYLVDAVVEMPYGAHPCSSMGLFHQDEEHMREYLNATKTKEKFEAYLKKYVYGPKNTEEYIQVAGGKKRMKELEVKWT